MTVPFKFKAGETARAEQINSNFNHIMSLLGEISNTGKLVPPGEIAMGPRKLAQLSAAHDTGSSAKSFFQIGWNADWDKVGTDWAFKRVLPSNPAAAIRIGRYGVELLHTSYTTGNLHAQLVPKFKFWSEASQTFVGLQDGTRILNVLSKRDVAENERLTYVSLSTPKRIYNSIKMNKGASTINAFNFVPRHARAIQIQVRVLTNIGSNVLLQLYQARDPRQVSKWFGVTIYGHSFVSGGKRYGYYNTMTGIVPLGRGDYLGKFIIERSNTFSQVYLIITGYYT